MNHFEKNPELQQLTNMEQYKKISQKYFDMYDLLIGIKEGLIQDVECAASALIGQLPPYVTSLKIDEDTTVRKDITEEMDKKEQEWNLERVSQYIEDYGYFVITLGMSSNEDLEQEDLE